MMLSDALFVSDAPIERKVEIGGVTHTVYMRELPAVEWVRYYAMTQDKADDTRFGAIAHLIAASLCDQDGTPALTRERAMQLKAAALNALFTAVLDINGSGPEKK